MSMTIGPRNLTGPSSIARAAGAAVILSGVLVLAGWTFDVAVLKSLDPRADGHEPRGDGPGLPAGRRVAVGAGVGGDDAPAAAPSASRARSSCC